MSCSFWAISMHKFSFRHNGSLPPTKYKDGPFNWITTSKANLSLVYSISILSSFHGEVHGDVYEIPG